jgi:hypothetical protein
LWRLAHGRVLPRTGSGTAALAHGGLGPRPPRPPGGAPGPETGPPQAWAPPYSCATLPPAAGSPSRKRSGYRWTGGSPEPKSLRDFGGGLDQPASPQTTAVSQARGLPPLRASRFRMRFPGNPVSSRRRVSGRLWLRGEGGAWAASRGARPGAPAGSTSPARPPGPARPGLPPSPPAWPDPDSPVAGCPGEPRMVPPARRPPVPCKHRTRTPPRTVPWSTSPGHRPRLVGLRAGRRRPEPERGQEAPLCAWTRSNHGPGGTGHGPVCWDVVLRVCSPRCCHLPCAPVARVRQTRVPCPPRSPSFHRNKRGPGRFSTQVPGTGTRNR